MIKRSSKSGGGGSAPIGSQQILGFGSIGTDEATAMLGDESVWLRAGSLGLASDFPGLAALKRYGFVGKLDYSTAVAVPSAPHASGLHAYDSTRNILVIASSTAGRILRSGDGGATFTEVALPSCTQVYGIASNNSDRFVVVGRYGGESQGLWVAGDGTSWSVPIPNLASSGSSDAAQTGDQTSSNSTGAICWAGGTRFIGVYLTTDGANSYGFRSFVYTGGGNVTKKSSVIWFGGYPTMLSFGVASDTNGNAAIVVGEYGWPWNNYGFVSADNGETWTSKNAGENKLPYAAREVNVAVVGGKAFFSSLDSDGLIQLLVVPVMNTMSNSILVNPVKGKCGGGSVFFQFGSNLYTLGQNSLGLVDQINYTIDSKNIVSSAIFCAGTKFFGYGQRGKKEMLPITDDLTRIDSCGMLGSTIPNADQNGTRGSTYVRAK